MFARSIPRITLPFVGLALAGFLVAACDTDLPTDMQTGHPHSNGLVLAGSDNPMLARGNSQLAHTLNDLRKFSAPFHNFEKAEDEGYSVLFKAPGLTSPDGCISDQDLGGMGYHYTKPDDPSTIAVVGPELLVGAEANTTRLLEPEFLVYAPKKGPRKNDQARRRLATFDYFILYSDVWPGPDDPNFVSAPTTEDFPTLQDLPETAFAASRFGGWMFHIWLWQHNPDGIFKNWNDAVPLCENSPA